MREFSGFKLARSRLRLDDVSEFSGFKLARLRRVGTAGVVANALSFLAARYAAGDADGMKERRDDLLFQAIELWVDLSGFSCFTRAPRRPRGEDLREFPGFELTRRRHFWTAGVIANWLGSLAASFGAGVAGAREERIVPVTA